MAKDPVQALVDEITLIRDEVRGLQRTSLSKNEAKALNSHVAQVLAQMKAVAGEMSTAASEAPRTVRNAIQHDLLTIEHATSQIAARAAREAIEGVQTKLEGERVHFARAAERAHRAAWSFTGGVWVWMAAMLATGALLGALMAYGTETAKSFFTIEQMVPYGCGKSWFGGYVGTNDGERTGCVFWYD